MVINLKKEKTNVIKQLIDLYGFFGVYIVIYVPFLGKALNGSNFVHIRLRLRGNSSRVHDAVRNFASIFLRRTGISMEGTEIYTRTGPSDQKRNGTDIRHTISIYI